MTRNEVADPRALAPWLEVDGQRHQDGNTRTLIFKIPHLTTYLSRCMNLQPGDVISISTPPASAWHQADSGHPQARPDHAPGHHRAGRTEPDHVQAD